MAVTIFHRIININNNNHIRIINKTPEKKAIKISGDIRTTKHTITESKQYE